MKKTALLIIFFAVTVMAYNQGIEGEKVHDIFLKYITTKLSLNSQELSQMQVLVPRYFNELRKIHKNNTDPLLREQQKIAIKIKYRDQLIPLLGEKRANQVFIEEQLFRKRIREELKQRNTMPR